MNFFVIATIDKISKVTGAQPDDILNLSRKRIDCDARCFAIYLMRKLMTNSEVRKVFNIDSKTVIHNERKFIDLMEYGNRDMHTYVRRYNEIYGKG